MKFKNKDKKAKNPIDEAVEKESNESASASEQEDTNTTKESNSESKEDSKEASEDKIDEPKLTKEQEYLQALQHTMAEFENYRKRVERDREEYTKFASEGLVKSLLPSLDNFERCLVNVSEESYKEFQDGIQLVHDEIWKELNNAGVKRINAEDNPFNPELHEPLLQEESDKPENTVLQVLEAGYTLNGKVLRHARVKLSKKKSK